MEAGTAADENWVMQTRHVPSQYAHGWHGGTQYDSYSRRLCMPRGLAGPPLTACSALSFGRAGDRYDSVNRSRKGSGPTAATPRPQTARRGREVPPRRVIRISGNETRAEDKSTSWLKQMGFEFEPLSFSIAKAVAHSFELLCTSVLFPGLKLFPTFYYQCIPDPSRYLRSGSIRRI